MTIETSVLLRNPVNEFEPILRHFLFPRTGEAPFSLELVCSVGTLTRSFFFPSQFLGRRHTAYQRAQASVYIWALIASSL